MLNKQKNSPRKIGTFMDTVHIVIGLLITVFAVFAIFRPDRFRFLFPVVFFLAAVLNFFTAWFYFVSFQRQSLKRSKGYTYLVIGVLIFVLFVISAISIWGGSLK